MVFEDFAGVEAFGLLGEGEGLGRAGVGDLDEEEACGLEEARPGGEEGADEVEAVGAAAEGEVWLVVFDVGFDGGPFVVGDVGGVADEVVEGGVAAGDGVVEERLEEVAVEEFEAVGDGVANRVVVGDGEGVGREVGGDDASAGEVFEEGDGDAARACADVGEEEAFALGAAAAGLDANMLEDVLDDGLGGGARDEDAFVDLEGQAEEPGFGDEVLDGLVLEGTRDEVSEGLAFEVVGGSVGVGVELEAVASDDVGHEHFGHEARGIEAFFGEGVAHPSEETARGPGVGRGVGGQGELRRRVRWRVTNGTVRPRRGVQELGASSSVVRSCTESARLRSGMLRKAMPPAAAFRAWCMEAM